MLKPVKESGLGPDRDNEIISDEETECLISHCFKNIHINILTYHWCSMWK